MVLVDKSFSRHLSFILVTYRIRIFVFFHGLNLIDSGIFWQLNFTTSNQICNILSIFEMKQDT